MTFSCVSRRSLLTGAASTLALTGIPLSATAKAVEKALDDYEVMTWTSCVVNCGSRCPLRVFSKHGQVIRIEDRG